MRRRCKCLFVILPILILAMLALVFLRSKPAEMTVSLLYKGASEGKNPDGTRLDPYGIISHEILDDVGAKMCMTEEELLVSLTVAYLGAVDQTTTDISVECDTGDEEKDVQILTALGEAYASYMDTKFKENCDVIYEHIDVSDMDYLQASDTLEMEANRLSGYINYKMNENEIQKQQYAVLADATKNLVNIRIRGMREVASKRGISSKPGVLYSIMQYRKHALERSITKSTRQKEAREKAIALYDSTLFPTTSVPSIQNSGEYYISTTKTGLDDIFTGTKFFVDEEMSFENQLSHVNYILANLRENQRSIELEPEMKAIADELNRIKAECVDILEHTSKEGYVKWVIH